MKRIAFLMIVVLSATAAAPQRAKKKVDVHRGRNEGTYTNGSSNVLGNGNILTYTAVESGYSTKEFGVDPILGVSIGVGGVLQFNGQTAFSNFSRVGPMEAHLQITVPGNDKLRLFGAALIGDLYLSTALDTISLTTEESKPEYNPYLRLSLVLDVDLLSRFKKVPLKGYLAARMVDDMQLLYRYDQLVFSNGWEWKGMRHSIFCDVGISLFKEKRTRVSSGDRTYAQSYAWIEPGGRYRILNRFSVVGGIRIALVQRVKQENPLAPPLVKAGVRLEAPLFFRETNTEAIRSLVFMEQQKNRLSERVAAAGEGAERSVEALGLTFDFLGEEENFLDLDRDREQLKKRRREIQDKMEEIESILKEIE